MSLDSLNVFQWEIWLVLLFKSCFSVIGCIHLIKNNTKDINVTKHIYFKYMLHSIFIEESKILSSTTVFNIDNNKK